MRKRIVYLLAAAALLTAGGCSSQKADSPAQVEGTATEEGTVEIEKPQETEEPEEAPAPTVSSRGAWCVYWDENSAQAVADHLSGYDEMILFGCVYEKDFSLYVPEELVELYEGFPKEDAGTKVYLSFINDVMQEDGTSQQKSVEFLEQALKDDELGNRLIEDMIAQTKSWGLDGVELDYENMHKGEDLWNDYLGFLGRLYDRTEEEGLLLRVVLGAYAPVDEYSFISGPQYVVMCYNLYGTHSEPGPKADEPFLKEMAHRYAKMDVIFAIANGGYEWDEQGKAVKSLTARQAQSLAQESGAETVRDESGAVTYTYSADEGLRTVWYGDEETMRAWEEMLAKYSGRDISVDLWRLE